MEKVLFRRNDMIEACVVTIPAEPPSSVRPDLGTVETPCNQVEYQGRRYQFLQTDVDGCLARAFDIDSCESVLLEFPEEW